MSMKSKRIKLEWTKKNKNSKWTQWKPLDSQRTCQHFLMQIEAFSEPNAEPQDFYSKTLREEPRGQLWSDTRGRTGKGKCLRQERWITLILWGCLKYLVINQVRWKVYYTLFYFSRNIMLIVTYLMFVYF